MCLFCDIIDNKIPSNTIYEDDIVKCILDLNQMCLGHTLIIPKKHVLNIEDIDNDTLKHLLDVYKILNKRIEDKLKCDGMSIMINSGIAQDIKHFHIHLMPKYNDKKEMDIKDLYEILKED